MTLIHLLRCFLGADLRKASATLPPRPRWSLRVSGPGSRGSLLVEREVGFVAWGQGVCVVGGAPFSVEDWDICAHRDQSAQVQLEASTPHLSIRGLIYFALTSHCHVFHLGLMTVSTKTARLPQRPRPTGMLILSSPPLPTPGLGKRLATLNSFP